MKNEKNLKQLLQENTFVVVDLETTGLSPTPTYGEPSRIIEIGAVKVQNGKIIDKFSTFCACPVSLPEFIVEITGITDKDLIGAPCVNESLQKLKEFCNGCYLAGHNFKFDLSFLNHYSKELGFNFDQPYCDTLTLARMHVKDKVENCKLNTIANYFNVKFKHHRALDDALATAQILLKFAEF